MKRHIRRRRPLGARGCSIDNPNTNGPTLDELDQTDDFEPMPPAAPK